MPAHIIVWDLETIPDLKGLAAANGHDGKTDHEIRAEMGDKFPKHIYHSIICIGALIVRRDNEHWQVDALGAPHVGDRSERELITSFVNRIAELSPQLVTFNGSEFDLPVLRYRAMVHKVTAKGLSARPYFHRFTEDAVDLCDVLCSFTSHRKASLHELCRVMGLPGKPGGMGGGDVERYYREGADSADCGLLRKRRGEHLPALAATRVLFRGKLTEAGRIQSFWCACRRHRLPL